MKTDPTLTSPSLVIFPLPVPSRFFPCHCSTCFSFPCLFNHFPFPVIHAILHSSSHLPSFATVPSAYTLPPFPCCHVPYIPFLNLPLSPIWSLSPLKILTTDLLLHVTLCPSHDYPFHQFIYLFFMSSPSPKRRIGR